MKVPLSGRSQRTVARCRSRSDRQSSTGPHLRYQPALDGLRALAVLGVMGLHAGLPFLHAGGVGVYVFFALSGFLITRLLLEEHAGNGRVAFGRFYLRRALRLLPALLLLLAVGSVYSVVWAPPGQGHQSLASVPAVIFYFANWVRALSPVPQLGLYEHTWSLSVEEQFYLIWPVLLLTLLRSRTLRPALIVISAGFVATGLWRAHLYHGLAQLNRVANGTDTVADHLLAGCLVAVVLSAGERWRPWGQAVGASRGHLMRRPVGVTDAWTGADGARA